MGFDKKGKTPPGDDNNQPIETSGNAVITNKRKYTRRERGCQVHVDTLNTSFEGGQLGIGVVFVTMAEKMKKKASLDIFHEKLGNYIPMEFNKKLDTVCVVRDTIYPIKYFEKKQNPKSMSADALKDTIKVATQQQR